ncbi:hypothetical protein BT63DRAFT_423515 [Microthyrium microscopicum]|uniref:CFEM domain-containing protein n=1 Tax=Microthyrium microscopicum TaxID=703497 RepID=A0A6A6UGI3_9PEZI|nr:hypothetical protein BT63DRAFT_423515 [Microthyrium microscopicum]
MKFTLTIAALVVAAFAAPQLPSEIGQIPPCGLACAMNAGKEAGCGPTDIKCFCTSATALAAATACVNKDCSPEDAKKAIALAQQLCAKY